VWPPHSFTVGAPEASAVNDDGYVITIKPSARKRSGAVGEWVNREGPTRRFDTKALAREWARSCSGPTATVWVQDAVPWDESAVDGYLVGRSSAGEPVERVEPGDQRTLDADASLDTS